MHAWVGVVAEHPVVHELHLAARLAVNVVLLEQASLRLLFHLVVVLQLWLLLNHCGLKRACRALRVDLSLRCALGGVSLHVLVQVRRL